MPKEAFVLLPAVSRPGPMCLMLSHWIRWLLLVPPPGLVSVREGGGSSMLLCSVATAISFLLWMQSLVTSSSAFTSSAVLSFTTAPGSKLKTCGKRTFLYLTPSTYICEVTLSQTWVSALGLVHFRHTIIRAINLPSKSYHAGSVFRMQSLKVKHIRTNLGEN